MRRRLSFGEEGSFPNGCLYLGVKSFSGVRTWGFYFACRFIRVWLLRGSVTSAAIHLLPGWAPRFGAWGLGTRG